MKVQLKKWSTDKHIDNSKDRGNMAENILGKKVRQL